MSVFPAFFGLVIMLCPAADAATELVLYAFKGGGDAAKPVGGLAVIGHTIYGASINGGRSGDGAIFAVTISGVERIVHDFAKGGGGVLPEAGPIAVGGALYGINSGRLANYRGNVIRVGLSGGELVLHRFAGEPSDGSMPYAPLLYRRGKYYGTTELGGGGSFSCSGSGQPGCGTVFSVTPSGRERVLCSFGSGTDIEGVPLSQLAWDDGLLYGTTSGGGIFNGTVFSLSTAGTEKVLHTFTGTPDGATPVGGLLDVGGLFYGTTTGGGADGNGTVFSITSAGVTKILYSFQGGTDGAYPTGDLINVAGRFYGTTTAGGGGPCTINKISGCGTVFSIKPDGTETVLHRFHSGTDGADPQGPLVSIGANLYGVTSEGGSGTGTVFVIKP
jgi:uncharacterized repeat protein (TIGR03803 family)